MALPGRGWSHVGNAAKEWSDAYTIGRNTDESYHAYVKDTGHEAVDIPSRRRIRGFAAHQIMATMLLVSANIRKIVTFLTERETQAAKRDTTAQPGLGKVRKTTRRRDREGHSNYKAKWPLKVLPGAPDGAELDSPLVLGALGGAEAAQTLIQASPGYLLLGLFLVAAGNVFFEFAGVNYNAMLGQVSTPRTIGKVSGFGWGMGYIGGIALLLIVYFGLINPEVGLFGVTSENGLAVRVSMLIAAAWFGLFALPVLLRVPEYRAPEAAARAKVGFFCSYVELGRDVARLWRTSRQTVHFLIASAIFRDGLAGVFTFGGVLAAAVFGFSPGDVIIFAIAANVVAGIATISVGVLDDRLGAKPVIITALVGLIVSGLLVFLLHDGGQIVFWTAGLALCLFVGPAQSASRTFLARLIPAGREGEVFGLYATTGRAASFLAPTAFALMVTLFGETYWGILGIMLVLLVGLLLLLPVKARQNQLS